MYKQPITDLGKKSKKGLLSLERDAEGRIITVEEGKGDANKVRHLIMRVCIVKYSTVQRSTVQCSAVKYST